MAFSLQVSDVGDDERDGSEYVSTLPTTEVQSNSEVAKAHTKEAATKAIAQKQQKFSPFKPYPEGSDVSPGALV